MKGDAELSPGHKQISGEGDPSAQSTDALLFEAFTGRKAGGTGTVTAPAQQPELGTPARKIMSGPQALELGRAVTATAARNRP